MRKKSKIMIIIASVVAFVFSITAIFIWSDFASKKNANSVTYRILQITDTHIRNDHRDKATFETIDMMIKESSPNLIIVTGDISSNQDNESDFKKFAEFIETYKIEWTFTFGNHDTEGNWKKPDVSAYLQSLEYCTYQDGYVVAEKENDIYTQGSYGNYFQNIKNSKGKIITTLFMMDSNMYINDTQNNYNGYANFKDEQIIWYEEKVKEVAKITNKDESKVVPSLAFFHIPFEEFKFAHKEGTLLHGKKYEDIYCSPKPDMMFEKMVELGSTKACFVGHDHLNNFAAEYKGIKLVYSYSTDHSLYFVPKRGGTLIEIKNNSDFTIKGLYRNFGVDNLIVTNTY